MNRYSWITLIAATVASAGFATSVYGQTESTALFVDDPRPLEAAMLSLIRSYPITITYEDPRYEYSGDIKDITDQVLKSPNLSSHRVLIPRGGVLQATYQVSRDTSQPVSVADTVQSIVDAQNASVIGGRFAVYQRGGAFHIVPSEARDSRGIWVKQRSILDTPITFSSEESNGVELIEAILKRVGEASGANILGLSAERFLNLFFRYKGTIEAKDEPARDVLMRALHSISPRLTWVLNYDHSGLYYVFAADLSAEPPAEEIPLDLSKLPGDPPIRVRPRD
jgi:hypothetical protein